MAFLRLNGTRICYELSGSDDRPALMFSNSLGTNMSMWDRQMPVLARDFRILRYDTRGHGQSSAPPGPYTIDQLARDVLAILDHLGIEQVHFCGLSMGGMIGMSLALEAPQRLGKLVLCSTAAKIGSAEQWNTRIDTVQKQGMRAVVDGVLERWYTPAFRAGSPWMIDATRQMLLATPVEGYTGCCAAIRDADLRDAISRIQASTLILTGTHDPVAPPSDGHFLEQHIPAARYRELPAAHLSNIEAGEAFTMELSSFLRA
jgi:3-oxoadipate enol-lactonase